MDNNTGMILLRNNIALSEPVRPWSLHRDDLGHVMA